eukprot:12934820-Prorocentrum_lima.AAC.1
MPDNRPFLPLQRTQWPCPLRITTTAFVHHVLCGNSPRCLTTGLHAPGQWAVLTASNSNMARDLL